MPKITESVSLDNLLSNQIGQLAGKISLHINGHWCVCAVPVHKRFVSLNEGN